MKCIKELLFSVLPGPGLLNLNGLRKPRIHISKRKVRVKIRITSTIHHLIAKPFGTKRKS